MVKSHVEALDLPATVTAVLTRPYVKTRVLIEWRHRPSNQCGVPKGNRTSCNMSAAASGVSFRLSGWCPQHEGTHGMNLRTMSCVLIGSPSNPGFRFCKTNFIRSGLAPIPSTRSVISVFPNTATHSLTERA